MFRRVILVASLIASGLGVMSVPAVADEPDEEFCVEAYHDETTVEVCVPAQPQG
jgi:hypothetical protein